MRHKDRSANAIARIPDHRVTRYLRPPATLTLIVLLVTLAVLGSADTAWARSYWIEDFQVTLEITEDGSLLVTEAIRFRFEGSYNGISNSLKPLCQRTDSIKAARHETAAIMSGIFKKSIVGISPPRDPITTIW